MEERILLRRYERFIISDCDRRVLEKTTTKSIFKEQTKIPVAFDFEWVWRRRCNRKGQ